MSIYEATLRKKLRKTNGDQAELEQVTCWYIQLLADGKIDEHTLSAYELSFVAEIKRA